MTTHQPIDVAIIGGGPAGYAAAIYAARSNLTTTVIEQGMSGGQIATTNEVENYPGIPLLSGAELGERFQQHAEGLGAQVEWSMVTGVDYDADAALFTVHHDMGDTLASSVIACMGAMPRSAGFVGEDTYRGRGVSYCATCDGMFFRGKQVFVIGGGNAACEEALFLSEVASSVTIVLRRDQFRAPDGVVQKVLAKDNVSVRYQTSIVELSGEAMPTTITFKHNAACETYSESFDPGSFGIFVFAGTQAPYRACRASGGSGARRRYCDRRIDGHPHAWLICCRRYPFQAFTSSCDRCFGRSHSGYQRIRFLTRISTIIYLM